MERLQSKGTEIQSGDVAEIATQAASQLSKMTGSSLFVEDTGLWIDQLGGFPGAYGSYVYATLGLEGVLRLLEDRPKRDAHFQSAVAYCDAGGEPKVFVGRLEGIVATTPRGGGGFGFDPIFVPLDSKKTLAEMSLEEKSSVSHRSRALNAFADWFESQGRL